MVVAKFGVSAHLGVDLDPKHSFLFLLKVLRCDMLHSDHSYHAWARPLIVRTRYGLHDRNTASTWKNTHGKKYVDTWHIWDQIPCFEGAGLFSGAKIVPKWVCKGNIRF